MNVVLTLLVALVSSSASAQDAEVEPEDACPECRCLIRGGRWTPYANAIYVDPMQTLNGRLLVEYERAVHPRIVLSAALYAVAFDSKLNNDLVGMGLQLGGRIILYGDAPEGLWLGGDLGFLYRRVRGQSSIWMFGPELAALLGYTGIFGRFALLLGAGPALFVGKLHIRDEGDVSGHEWGPRIKLAFGVAF
jgi:hypothetical protein